MTQIQVRDERLLWSIRELTDGYAKGDFSPVEIIEAALGQLDESEGDLNAFVSVYADEAIEAAKAAEAAYAANRASVGDSAGHGALSQSPQGDGTDRRDGVGPLTGVPIGLKDLTSVAGRRTTMSSRILSGYIPDVDAPVWQNIRQQGGILLGKTNMLEFAYGVAHPDYGQTNNPHDVERTSGGSSGGSAAAVASGILYGALGTDTGGSIRIPASYCGVVGLKPTYGLVSAEGIFPLSYSLDHVGPIARTAEDAAIFLDAMTGQSEYGALVRRPSGVRRVGVLPESVLRYIQPAVLSSYQKAIERMEDLGLFVDELPASAFADMERAEPILMTILLPEAAQIHRAWWARERDYAELTWQQIAAGRKVAAVDYLAAMVAQRVYRNAIAKWFETFDVIATPTLDFPAPKEDPAIGDEAMNELRYTGPFNVSGNPAVSVNCGFTREGLPIGIQLVGPMNGDGKLLAFAREFEQTNSSIG